MEIKRLSKCHYNQLIDLLDNSFAKKGNRRRSFTYELPKMQYTDEEHVSKHIGIFDEDRLVSVIGIYPFNVKVGEKNLIFATTGNVATHWDYSGRGYMDILLKEALKQVKLMNVDCVRLGGLRQRYARYGFEPVGQVYEFCFNQNNRQKLFSNLYDDIIFKYITKEDVQYLSFVQELYENDRVVIKRDTANNFLDMYYALNFWTFEGFIALKNNQPIGYVCASKNGENINEIKAIDLSCFQQILCAWQKTTGKDIVYKLPCFNIEEISASLKICEYTREYAPSHFNVLNYEKVVEAFMILKSSYTNFTDGQFIMEIEGYGTIKLFSHKGQAGAIRTNETPDIILDSRSAMQVLFGYGGKYYLPKDINPIVHQFCPLPLSWNKQDAI